MMLAYSARQPLGLDPHPVCANRGRRIEVRFPDRVPTVLAFAAMMSRLDASRTNPPAKPRQGSYYLPPEEEKKIRPCPPLDQALDALDKTAISLTRVACSQRPDHAYIDLKMQDVTRFPHDHALIEFHSITAYKIMADERCRAR